MGGSLTPHVGGNPMILSREVAGGMLRLWRRPQNGECGRAVLGGCCVSLRVFLAQGREHIPLNWYRTPQSALGVSELPAVTGVMYTHRQTLFLYSHRLTQKLNHILGLST